MVVDEVRVLLVVVTTYPSLSFKKDRAKTTYSHPPLMVVAVVCNLVVIACNIIPNLKTEDLGKDRGK